MLGKQININECLEKNLQEGEKREGHFEKAMSNEHVSKALEQLSHLTFTMELQLPAASANISEENLGSPTIFVLMMGRGGVGSMGVGGSGTKKEGKL